MFKRYPQWYNALMLLIFVAGCVIVARTHQEPYISNRVVIGSGALTIIVLAIMLFLGPKRSVEEEAWEKDLKLIMGVLNDKLVGPSAEITAWRDGPLEGLQRSQAGFVDPAQCYRLGGTNVIHIASTTSMSARPTTLQQALVYYDPMETTFKEGTLKVITFGMSSRRVRTIATEGAAPLAAIKAHLLGETSPLLSAPKPQPRPR